MRDIDAMIDVAQMLDRYRRQWTNISPAYCQLQSPVFFNGEFCTSFSVFRQSLLDQVCRSMCTVKPIVIRHSAVITNIDYKQGNSPHCSMSLINHKLQNGAHDCSN